MTTIETIWNNIVPYLTSGTLIGVLVTALLTGLKLVKYQKATRIDSLRAIEDKLASLSVNKDVRLSLETMSRAQLKNIEKTLTDKIEKALDAHGKEVAETAALVKAIAGALATIKQMPGDKVIELNAALGLTTPATVIELKPVEIETPKAVAESAAAQGIEKVNPFAG